MFLSIALSIVYSAVWFISKAQTGQVWDWQKFVRTVIIGAGVGIAMVMFWHQPVTFDTVSIAVASVNFTIITVVDKLVSIIWGIFKKKA